MFKAFQTKLQMRADAIQRKAAALLVAKCDEFLMLPTSEFLEENGYQGYGRGCLLKDHGYDLLIGQLLLYIEAFRLAVKLEVSNPCYWLQ